MAKYKYEFGEVEAEQFLPPHQIPKGVINVYQMGGGTEDNPTWYSGEINTTTSEKRQRVSQGEWVIEEPEHQEKYYIVLDEVFKRKYQKIISDMLTIE